MVQFHVPAQIMEQVSLGYWKYTSKDLQNFINTKGLPGNVSYLYSVVGQAVTGDPRGIIYWEPRFNTQFTNAILEAVKPAHLKLLEVVEELKINPDDESLKLKKVGFMKEIANTCRQVENTFGFNKNENSN